MRFLFFLKEAFRGLSRNSAPALAALLTILLTTLVLGVFIPIVQATTGTANEVRGRVVVDVFVKKEANPIERAELKRELDKTVNVGTVEFISKESALAREKRLRPEAYKALGERVNPLPDTYRVTPEDPGKVNLIINHLTSHGVVETSILYASPFTDLTPSGPEGLFSGVQVDELVTVLGRVKEHAVAA